MLRAVWHSVLPSLGYGTYERDDEVKGADNHVGAPLNGARYVTSTVWLAS